MDREEYVRRFVDRMVSIAGETGPDGESVREYAAQAAESYLDAPDRDSDATPEEDADVDMSYWEPAES